MIKTFWLNRFRRVLIKQVNRNCLFPANNLHSVSPNPEQQMKEHPMVSQTSITIPTNLKIIAFAT